LMPPFENHASKRKSMGFRKRQTAAKTGRSSQASGKDRIFKEVVAQGLNASFRRADEMRC
ncbi:MAG: hypothetical protein Q8P02_05025, partial [Candidatus Micrarchaeota archaeon]|nr:hypothetical protein [Candidatus Micrarchaeota archaeon]